MASAAASGFPLLAPSLRLPKSLDRQVSATMVHGAVNCLVQKSNLGDPFRKTSIDFQRRARRSYSRKAAIDHDKIYKLKVAATGAESNINSEGGDSEKESSQKQSELKRRELLWAATSSFSYLSSAGLVQSAPVPPSDLFAKNCSPVPLVTYGKTQECCLPDATGLKPIQFEFEDLPMRTRRPAHVLLKEDRDYVCKYNEAYRRMKALPDDDPRNFRNQWYQHCAFCDGAYAEPGSQYELSLEYHFSWAFLPWHRMYVYFHERILGELIGDPYFTIPFWNWDNQTSVGGNQMPRIFTDHLGNLNNELRDAIRNSQHFPPSIVNLNPDVINDEKINRYNLSVMYRAVACTTSAFNFFGGPYRANQPFPTTSPGTSENYGHNAVHSWTGSDEAKYPENQDMGQFIYSGRDPLFYSHHANVDRLWTVWKTLPDLSTRGGRRRRREWSKPDFKNMQFAFYDHKKRLVHVKISDTLDTYKLRYKYEAMDSDWQWIHFKPRTCCLPKPLPPDLDPFATTAGILDKDESTTFLLARRAPTADETEDHADEALTPEDLEETLLIKGVKVPQRRYMAYRVFINRPDADRSTPLDIYEFAGLITHLPHAGNKGSHSRKSGHDFRISIGANMKSLELPVGEPVSVTFVPVNQKEDVLFDGVEPEWR